MRSFLFMHGIFALVLTCGAAEAATLEDPASPDSLDELIVTAQRRSEKLQDVPITITQVSGAALENAGVTGTEDLGQMVPAFRLDSNGGYAQPSIRGVSTSISNPGGGSSIGIYVDGFYNPSPLSSDFEFLNVDSVQVLKGPQGTLFGRNTTGGAVLVTTADPSLQTAIKGQVDYGRFETARVSGYATGGLTGNIAGDVAVLLDRSDGFLTKLSTDDHDIGDYQKISLRTGVKLFLDGDDYVMARFAYNQDHDSSIVNYSIYQAPNGRWETAADAFDIPGANWGRERGQTDSDPGFQPIFKYRVYNGQLTAKFDLNFANLLSYTQYRDELSSHDLDIDGSSAVIVHAYFPNTDKTFTQEVTLNSKSNGPLDWVVGGFYMHQETGQVLNFVAPPAGAAYGINNTVSSVAGFGDVTYQAVKDLYLTAGIRVSHETNDGGWVCYQGAPVLGTPCPGKHLEGSWNNASPRAVVRYELTPQSNVYVSYAQGYKAGMIDPNGFSTNLVDPEKLNSYETGFKYGDNRLRLAASAFYYDYKDLQFFTSEGTYSITTNAAQSKMYGGEISGDVKIMQGLSVNAGVAYTHARYDQFPNAPSNVFNFTTGQVSTAPTNASGNYMIRAPEWSGNIAPTYTVDAMGGELAFNANAYFTSEVFFDPANLNRQGGYVLMNSRAAWTDPSKRLTVAVYGDNLADRRYLIQVLPNGFGVGSIWGEPRTFGISVGFKY